MRALLAAITPDAAPPADPDPFPTIEKSVTGVDVPWPDWAWWAIGAVALVLFIGLVFLIVWLARRKFATPPPSPRVIAQLELRALRENSSGMDAYAFGVAVSDVLRKFIAGQFGLQAPAQTSPEFLASIAKSARFTDADRSLLGAFLEQCDLRKFARVEAAENESLLQSAYAFVESASQ